MNPATTFDMHMNVQRMQKATKFVLLTAFFSLLFIVESHAGTASGGVGGATGAGDSSFQEIYDFIANAATGYLGRAIALFGGIVGLAVGASSGKAMPAIMGVILAVFGTVGPKIIENLFAGAII